VDTVAQLIARPQPWRRLMQILALLTASMAAQYCSGAGIASPPDAVRQAQLISLVRQDCGSCHGMTLKGGLGPALLPQTLQDQPVAVLKSAILHGRPGTAMPPWQRFLTDAEAEWIVVNLQKGFPGGR